MSKRKKILVSVLALVLFGLWLFEGRRVSFSYECLIAENELDQNFQDNKAGFDALSKLVNGSALIQFEMYLGDSLFMTFQDSTIDHRDLFIDSNYFIRPKTTSQFRINDSGCLEVIGLDTMEVCNHNWQVQFSGHYQDDRIDNLLAYSGWIRKDFDNLVKRVKDLNCYGFSKGNDYFSLGYRRIYYYVNTGILGQFGHSNGYFDYMHTAQPDSFPWPTSLTELENNYYGIKYWEF